MSSDIEAALGVTPPLGPSSCVGIDAHDDLVRVHVDELAVRVHVRQKMPERRPDALAALG